MHDTAYADAIEQSLAESLSTITEHWEGMTERRAIRPRVGRRPAPQSTPPVEAGITEVRATCNHRMHTLTRLLLEEHPDARPPHPDVTGPELADHLWAWVRELSTVVTATDADELASSARQVLHHAAPTRPDWMRIGSCPLLLEDGSTCGGEVRGWPHHTDEDGAAWCRCEACGAQAVASWWEAQGMGEWPETMDTATALRFAHKQYGDPVTQRAIENATSRRQLAPIEPRTKPLTFERKELTRWLSARAGEVQPVS